jgi:hypothetical protein
MITHHPYGTARPAQHFVGYGRLAVHSHLPACYTSAEDVESWQAEGYQGR